MLKYSGLILWATLILIAIFYGYPRIFDYTPRGQHDWRQTDCASLALNYYQDGMDFTKPRVHHNLGRGGHAVGEFPILYYITASLYHVFGANEGIFRVLNLLIFWLGLLALHRWIKEETQNIWFALGVPLLLFTSPIIGFYSFNFLSNAPAFGLVLMAWYSFYHFYKTQKDKWLYISMLFFLFAGLLKVTALISYVALLGMFGLEFIGVLNLNSTEKLFQSKWKQIIPFALVLVGVVVWYLVAMDYNETYQTNYFSTRTWPFWDMTWEDIEFAIDRTFVHFFPTYYHPLVHALFGSILIFIAFTPKSHNPLLYGVMLVSAFGIFLFYIIWGFAFINHDYYIINLLIVPVIGLVLFTKFVAEEFGEQANHWIVGLGIAGFIAFNALHTKTYITDSYQNENYYINPAFYTTELKEFLKEQDIQYPTRVLSTPDKSPNISLYHLNLKGWTDLYNAGFDSTNVTMFAQWNAEYLVISDKTYLEKPELQPVLEYPIGNVKGEIFFFDLKPYKKE